jgi:hypothetical protein
MAANSVLAYNVCKQAGSTTGTPPCSACSFVLGKLPKRRSLLAVRITSLRYKITTEGDIYAYQRKFTPGTSYVLNNEVNFRKAIERFGILGFQKVTGYAIEGNDLIDAPFITLEWAHGITLSLDRQFPYGCRRSK